MIFGVSSIPAKQLPDSIAVSDKLVHMVIYAILAVLFARAVAVNNQKPWFLLVWTITVAFVAFYGITDEFHQSYVFGRSSDLADWIADLVGGSIGSAIYLCWLRFRQKRLLNHISKLT